MTKQKTNQRNRKMIPVFYLLVVIFFSAWQIGMLGKIILKNGKDYKELANAYAKQVEYSQNLEKTSYLTWTMDKSCAEQLNSGTKDTVLLTIKKLK